MRTFSDPKFVIMKVFPMCGVSFSQLELGR